ncbi:MAG: hypothetical protein CVU43_21990 [Chloroflexi bacterium HGW-Chloroflexi-5]|nr:MAG: hypothetical protein CVU43_21990 [Chloroflexi bacterium HGW-Chloroflexi-5]
MKIGSWFKGSMPCGRSKVQCTSCVQSLRGSMTFGRSNVQSLRGLIVQRFKGSVFFVLRFWFFNSMLETRGVASLRGSAFGVLRSAFLVFRLFISMEETRGIVSLQSTPSGWQVCYAALKISTHS